MLIHQFEIRKSINAKLHHNYLRWRYLFEKTHSVYLNGKENKERYNIRVIFFPTNIDLFNDVN
jgi:hypothetical protein